MLGYLRAENPGVLEPPHDGWHDTGDIVTIDAQGFIRIKGRAKRFAKIGGEMVSLSAVEAMAAELWPQHVTVVVSVPDARKGERLLLYTNNKNATRQEYMAFARTRHVSELTIPAEIIYMEKLPMLGSGKVDLVNLAKMAKEERAEQAATRPPVPA
jgi:acyl-[acyl-carrier-protein]-phospholipid O-acyltransferase/long-chain-fatty-acid--[acyl-carrier-protein] ligase